MKNYIIILLLFSLYSLLFGDTNSNTSNCVSSTTSYTYGAGGYKLPSIGEVNILIVFAQFKDDNYQINNPRWEKNQAPQNMDKWLDQTWSTNPTQGSLTHYFNEMSGNKFKVTGKEIFIITNKKRQEYKALGWKRGDLNKELIQRIDNTEDFSNYDNWKLNSNYNHSNVADNKVDMVIVIWRNIGLDVPSSDYESEFGFGDNYGSLGYIAKSSDHYNFDVDGGARYLNTQDWGSGVTVRYYFTQDPFRVALHEFNHYLLGHNDMHNGFGYWGMLADWGTKSYTANAFEMYQLQWAKSTSYYTVDLTSSGTQTITKTIGDFLTTNKAIRIKYGTNKYFYIENHQKSSWWESHAPFSDHPNNIDGTVENGIYIIRQEGIYGSGRQCIPADGRNDWRVVDKITNPYDPKKILPVWKNYGIDPSGNHTLESITHNYPGCTESTSIIYFVKNPNSGAVEEPKYYLGTGTQAFRIGYNEVFSKWSNPNNQKENGNTINFAINLNSINGGTASITIYKNNPQSAPPSKPQNIKVTSNGTHPVVSWDANTEPDLAGYRIYRSVDGGSFLSLSYVNKYATSYVDESAKFSKPIWQVKMVYKIKAKDTQGKYSVYSNSDYIYAEENNIWKKAVKKAEEKSITTYSVSQNFPNPLNPTTTISYQIPKAGNVQIKVYDVLGKEVALLVNEQKEPGRYTVQFDASNLPSGLYFYRMQSGNFTDVRKMLLMK